MEGLMLAIMTAFWLGILTSISPCPLATNIAAISFIARDVGEPRAVLLTGILYTAGRSVTYIVLGVLLVGSTLAIPQVSYFLQTYMNKLLGPVLILVGMFLLGLLQVNISSSGLTRNLQRTVSTWGIGGAFPLGILFALSFCPVSAALFFGSLIPLALRAGSGLALPSFYGVGTALPVLAFAVLIALGARSVGKVFSHLSQIEKWARLATGCIFVAVGFYFSLAYIFGVFA